MTPKEKAEEIYNDFDMIIYTDQDHDSQVKRCSLLLVNKILNNCLFEQYSCGFLTLETKHEKYWEEVKEELIKL